MKNSIVAGVIIGLFIIILISLNKCESPVSIDETENRGTTFNEICLNGVVYYHTKTIYRGTLAPKFLPGNSTPETCLTE